MARVSVSGSSVRPPRRRPSVRARPTQKKHGLGLGRTLALARLFMSVRASSMRSCRVCGSSSSESDSAFFFRKFRGAILAKGARRGSTKRGPQNAGARERHLLPSSHVADANRDLFSSRAFRRCARCLPIGTDVAPSTATRAAGEIACARSRRVLRRFSSPSPDGRPADPPPSLARLSRGLPRDVSTIASSWRNAPGTKTRAWPRFQPPCRAFPSLAASTRSFSTWTARCATRTRFTTRCSRTC